MFPETSIASEKGGRALIILYICGSPPPSQGNGKRRAHISQARRIEEKIAAMEYRSPSCSRDMGKVSLKGGRYYVEKPENGSVSFSEIGGVPSATFYIVGW